MSSKAKSDYESRRFLVEQRQADKNMEKPFLSA
jgi:hypothetical protein